MMKVNSLPMKLWKKKEVVKEDIVEQKAVSEYPINVGADRKLIDLHISVFAEGGMIFVKREMKVNKPVRSADIACIISELEQLKMMLLYDYGKGKIMSVNKP